MAVYFKKDNFEEYYLNSSRYTKKNALVLAFWKEWFDLTNESYHYMTVDYAERCFKEYKKAIKVRLQGKGFTPAGIDGFYKAFSAWIKARKGK